MQKFGYLWKRLIVSGTLVAISASCSPGPIDLVSELVCTRKLSFAIHWFKSINHKSAVRMYQKSKASIRCTFGNNDQKLVIYNCTNSCKRCIKRCAHLPVKASAVIKRRFRSNQKQRFIKGDKIDTQKHHHKSHVHFIIQKHYRQKEYWQKSWHVRKSMENKRR